MINQPLVSVIMPAYNAENYIAEAIQSVLDQDYTHFELLIINDGSVDNTMVEIAKFSDHRIRIFNQKNKGVSSARNVGLDNINGVLFCFLDADDCFKHQGISSRVKIFHQENETDFVDGQVDIMNEDLTKVIRTWKPNFRGNPLLDLVKITGKSFFGPSWMINSNALGKIRFNESLTHCEDLLFFIELSQRGTNYQFINEVILTHRSHDWSSMNNLAGIENGYWKVKNILKKLAIPKDARKSYSYRIKLIMFLSYLSEKKIMKALSVIFKK